MSHLSKIFEEAPIKVQNRNGFDLSHIHSGTSKCGQLVPVLTKLIAPNSTVSLGVQAQVGLPPFVAPWYGKVDFCVEGFVVPLSILYGGWKQFITNNDISNFPSNQSVLTSNASSVTVTNDGVTPGYNDNWGKNGYKLPYVLVKDLVGSGDVGNYRTLDSANNNIYQYMGANIGDPSGSAVTITGSLDTRLSLLPGLAYHKICDVFYRNTKLTRTWFEVNPDWQYQTGVTNPTLPGYINKNVARIWHSFYSDISYLHSNGSSTVTGTAQFNDTASLTFPDGTSIFSTRQRPYSRDYFTSAVASPQQGGASTLRFDVDVSTAGSEFGTFTVNSLRMANALQKFLETNNLSGEYADMMRNRWGVRPIDADFDEPHYLGRLVVPVYKNSIAQTGTNFDSTTGSVSGGNGNNPFVNQGYIGAKAGNGGAEGDASICDNFNVSCWSYLMCIASLVPHANYSYGLNRELTMTKLGEFPAPELQTVGMEEIKQFEVNGRFTADPSTYYGTTFGYVPRYSRFKYVDDHCSGELRPSKTLEAFQLARSFAPNQPQSLGTSFCEIPTTALDSVLAVNTSNMKLTCWWEIYFKLHVSMPLADYCIPTLGELGDTHTIKTTVGGSRL